MSKKNERLQAYQILKQVLEKKTPMTVLLTHEPSPLTRAICYGVCRYFYRLDYFVQQLCQKKPDDELKLIIIIGLFQLAYLDKPSYVTVKETVALLEPLKKIWAKGFVNAILRRFEREKEEMIGACDSPNHPHWIIKRLKSDWPEQWTDILLANDQHPPLTLRVNQQRMSREGYLHILEEQNIAAQALKFSPWGIQLQQPVDVKELPGYQEGWFSVQDEAAQQAVSLLDLQEQHSVLDACCAPGGKTSFILETIPGINLTAIDIDAHRLDRVRANLTRLGLKAKLLTADILHYTQWWDGQWFDRILLDAPCSATGVIRRHPDIKLLRTEAEIEQAAQLQCQLLQQLWQLLKPGGLLVYATCSVMKQENEDIIRQFTQTEKNCTVMPIAAEWGNANEWGWQILPGQANTDGFFYSVLKKDHKQ